MPVESAADRAAFVNADDFGVTAVYTPFGSAASDPFAGIFDRPSTAAALDGVISTVDSRPTFFCRESDLPDGAHGDASDQIAVTGAGAFEVTSIEPDGAGMVVLRLGALV